MLRFIIDVLPQSIILDCMCTTLTTNFCKLKNVLISLVFLIKIFPINGIERIQMRVSLDTMIRLLSRDLEVIDLNLANSSSLVGVRLWIYLSSLP